VKLNPRRRRMLLVTFVLVAITGAVLLSVATRLTPQIRERAIAAVEERLQSDVDVESLQISVMPRPAVLGTGLIVRHHGRTDVEPLIRLGSYSASAGLLGLLRSPIRLRTIELERMDIHIPPGGVRGVRGTSGTDASPRSEPGVAPSASDAAATPTLVIDRLATRAARLVMVPRTPGKLARIFEIHDLVMHGLGDGDGSTFEATLTNPTPHGHITTRGAFGPWQADQPSRTPLRGDYRFERANLDTIKGIGGILSSTGTYSGVLERIDVNGETHTPDFSIDIAGQRVPLDTRFHAIVDGTNGDTWLERVDARTGSTVIVSRGAVVRDQDVKGRRISLDVTIDEGRIEDLLKLAVKSGTPLMTGQMRLKTTFLLPAGDEDVIDKLVLSGTFSLDEARFANVNVQEKINTLSRRGKGHAEGTGPGVVSKLSGTFTMKQGTLSFSRLSFAVPGAIVQLAGVFDVAREQLDFTGHLLLDARLADTTTGVKSLLARAAQPFFRRPGGGSKIPIRIHGPMQKPEFGLDVKRAFGPG
jgi:hypothetical protein